MDPGTILVPCALGCLYFLWKLLKMSTKPTSTVEWPFPNDLNKWSWRLSSRITFGTVGVISKLMISVFNKVEVHNRQILEDAVGRRPKHIPLLTVANHASCFDDPGLWGVLPFELLLKPDLMRWSLAAHDICFTNQLHSQFFARGNCIPVVRGGGVYQRAMDFCIDRLNQGQWVHIFPEGKVNETNEFMRFKWGIGRLLAECKTLPLILPIWHVGMDKILPNVQPYRFKIRNQVLLNVGEPIDLGILVEDLKSKGLSPELLRQTITERIQHDMMKLKESTESMYAKLLAR